MTIWFTFVCLIISQILLMLQKKTLPNSQKARFVELEEEFFTAMKQQEDALEKSFKRMQDDVDKRLEDFFTQQKAQEEKMNILLTDVVVSLCRRWGAPIPTDEKGGERSLRLKTLVNEHFKSNIAECVYMG
jgi:hypothetical protein